ncbi:hypothetical protein M422DRAFT_266728 [Sphaerobolus stellatus SS14]|uniref:Unplaced genomic scaffold SPHSTscaffold_165, whole genome shotgun sequence n=1 Tax=Sphaerobolus stellatus (strain SS14) TaxID=990650 RepID=A0A0C9UAM5_SPHS4|nr:hypothetical protein M422DRAFT_266728 [Sphaerobolus stellatus SS14]
MERSSLVERDTPLTNITVHGFTASVICGKSNGRTYSTNDITAVVCDINGKLILNSKNNDNENPYPVAQPQFDADRTMAQGNELKGYPTLESFVLEENQRVFNRLGFTSLTIEKNLHNSFFKNNEC